MLIDSENSKPIIGIVVGEKSGDKLGQGLIIELKKILPEASFVGLGGPLMQAEGFESIDNMEILSVMGIVEPLKRLPQILGLRRRLLQFFLTKRPLFVVGIDSPDFNLGLEKKLKQANINTCHYVCPSVWAWRQGRVKNIRESVDHVLALLPFEVEFLNKHDVPATFIGHPLAETLAHVSLNQEQAKKYLLDNNSAAVLLDEPLRAAHWVAIMPGSRESEINLLLEPFLQTINSCLQCIDDLFFVLPAATEAIFTKLSARLDEDDLQAIRSRILLVKEESTNCMIAADVVLLASGTATLEAALLQKPMVVAYRLSTLTYAIASRLVKTPYIALPNLLTEKAKVPEFIQDQVTPENLSQAILHWLNDAAAKQALLDSFTEVRSQLAQNGSHKAAATLFNLFVKAK